MFPICVQAGFNIHKIEDEHMMLVLELGGDEPPTPPVASASNQVAGGPGFVVKDQQAVLYRPKWHYVQMLEYHRPVKCALLDQFHANYDICDIIIVCTLPCTYY